MARQCDLARAAGLHQSRISMFETPGAANMTLETLARLAAAFKVGLVVKFVPFSEMLRSENAYSQDSFRVTPLPKDTEFLNPEQGMQQVAVGATVGTSASSLEFIEVKAGQRKQPQPYSAQAGRSYFANAGGTR